MPPPTPRRLTPEAETWLASWTERYTQSLIKKLRASLPTLDGPVIAAAITTADFASVPYLTCTTAGGIERTVERYAATWEITDSLRNDLTWWPDEWDPSCKLKLGGEDELACSRELDRWVGDHAEVEDDPEVVAARKALVKALGDVRVRQVFREFGGDPVLVVNETDGGEKEAFKAFEKLNSRGGVDVERARKWWARVGDGDEEGEGGVGVEVG